MLKRCVLCAWIGVLCGAMVWAQENPPEKPGADKAAAEEKAGDTTADGAGEAAAPEKPAVILPGDIITLKSGKKLTGIQVLRELPTVIEVEVQEGMEPLKLPRKQVQSIEYDNTDPVRQRRLEAFRTETAPPDIIPGEELSQEFNHKLKAPLSTEALSLKDIGFMNLLAKLCEKSGVELQVEESAKKLPMDQRIKSFEIPAGASLFTFLQTDFVAAYPALKVSYQYDKIVISGKEAEAGAGAPAPASGDAAAPGN